MSRRMGTGGLAVAGLLLAAGAGRRLGLPKALVRWDGRLLVERGVALLRAGGCDPVLVVLGAGAEQVRALADLAHAEVVVNPAWGTGMGSSLRAGLAALATGEDQGGRGRPAGPGGPHGPGRGPDAVVVALVDQPLVQPGAVRRLIDAWGAATPRPAGAVATYQGQPRNPVLLDRSAWAGAAAAATGDAGARTFLRAGLASGRVLAVACDDAGSAADIDTPAQLAAVQQSLREG